MIKDLLFIQREIPSLDPQFVTTFFGYQISNSTTTIFLILLLLVIFGVYAKKSFSIVPSNIQLIVESMYDAMTDLVRQSTRVENRHYHRLALIVFSVFVYLVFTNLITLIPGLGQITVGGKSLFATPTADINTVLPLALGTILIIQLVAIYEKGIFGYIFDFIRIPDFIKSFKKGGSILEGFIGLFMGLLDIVGEIAKIISLTLRLFANMLTGNVLAMSLLGIFSLVIPAIWTGMNAFFGILQAFVFAALIGGYYMQSMPEEKLNE